MSEKGLGICNRAANISGPVPTVFFDYEPVFVLDSRHTLSLRR
jgi:hypothetical protein